MTILKIILSSIMVFGLPILTHATPDYVYEYPTIELTSREQVVREFALYEQLQMRDRQIYVRSRDELDRKANLCRSNFVHYNFIAQIQRNLKVINAGISDDYAYRTYIKSAEKEIEKNNREVGRDCRDVLKEDNARYKKLLGIK
ncbi:MULTISPECIES: hypothetical protein [Acinetobacter]|uniref:hypothetical protein n=1 Tax=Acinetobacter TaxID=469 RepID=UPI0015D15345|nr:MULTISPECIES: hypothetical protein [Acinetobacter]MBF4521334.1 hypothetical protein [Acinetobacter towneri]